MHTAISEFTKMNFSSRISKTQRMNDGKDEGKNLQGKRFLDLLIKSKTSAETSTNKA